MTKRVIEKRYECLRKIGEGGMAIVYEAVDSKLNRRVAVKILHEHMQHREELRERFIQEARSVSKLKHSNILEIYDFSGEKSEELWVVTELLDGIDLSKFLKESEGKKIDPILASCIVREIALALEVAHAHGIIHRDIKPSNIMFTKQGRVKLMDFGIAKDASAGHLTQTGTFMGSPSYMSPEQIRGSGVSFSSDIYSLCILFYELVTGRVPFRGSNTAEIITKIIEDDAIPPKDIHRGLSPSINEFILKGLEKKPEYRFDRTDSLAIELAKILKEHGLGDSRVELEVYSKSSQSFFDKITLPPTPKQTLEIRPNDPRSKSLSNNSKSDQVSKKGKDASREEKPTESSSKDHDQSHSNKKKIPYHPHVSKNAPNNQTDKAANSIPHSAANAPWNAAANAATNAVSPHEPSAGTSESAKKQMLLPPEQNNVRQRRSIALPNVRPSFSRPWVITFLVLVLSGIYFSNRNFDFTKENVGNIHRIKELILGDSKTKNNAVRTPGVENPSVIMSDNQREESELAQKTEKSIRAEGREERNQFEKDVIKEKKTKFTTSKVNKTTDSNLNESRLATTGSDKNERDSSFIEERKQIRDTETSNRRPLDDQKFGKRIDNITNNSKNKNVTKNSIFTKADINEKRDKYDGATSTAKQAIKERSAPSKGDQFPNGSEFSSVVKNDLGATSKNSESNPRVGGENEFSDKAESLRNQNTEIAKSRYLQPKGTSSQPASTAKQVNQPKVAGLIGSKSGQLFVNANLTGQLRINGKSFGNLDPAGKTYELDAGAYEIRVSKEGFKTARGFARVEAGKITRLIDLTLEPEIQYKLIILNENSFEVEVTVSSGNLVQKYNLSKGTKSIALPAGTYNIKAIAGKKSLQRKISIPSPHDADGSVTFTLELDP